MSSQECTRLSHRPKLPSLDASHRQVLEALVQDDDDAAAGDDDDVAGHREELGFLDRSSSNALAFSHCSAVHMDSVNDSCCHLHHTHRH